MTGWAVEVRFQYMDGGWTPPQIWYVSSSVKEDAEKAVRETANVGESVRVEAKAQISDSVLEALKIPPGQTRQWL